MKRGNLTKIELTTHAKQAILERGISMEWIERVFAHPQKIEMDKSDGDLRHHLGKITEFGDRVLRVIFNHAVKHPRIVLCFDRNLRIKL